MQINKLLTLYNYSTGTIDRIRYIVIHYVGALGGAKANCQYYAGGDRGASAHYFVDFDGSVWQSVEDRNIAWHCGAKTYRHPECRNANSIGIEMCVRNNGSQADSSRDWYFEEATVQSAIELTKMIMDKYDIPADHVIRHYDVTGKICPNPYVYNDGNHTWNEFKAALSNKVGWVQENGGWRYYLGGGACVRNDWYLDGQDWYWFDGAGMMVHDVWYQYNGDWYYLGADGAMCRGQVTVDGKWYVMDNAGRMIVEPVVLTPDQDGALQYPGLTK